MDYEKFFKKIKEFKEIQNRQRLRGLNNYNILTSVLNQSDEVRLHSRMIYSFLNPQGEHYQGTLFLDKFLEVLRVKNFKLNRENSLVYREYQNIDLYITDGDKHIIIENKIYASDQKEQIKKYIEKIEKENKKLSKNDMLVIYLSLDREKPTQYSLGDLKIENGYIKREDKEIAIFKSIHYKKEILEWLKKSQYEVQNITNLNEAFNQYIDVVKKVTNQYKEKIVGLSDYLVKDKDIYKMAVEVQNALPEARKKIVNEFFEEVKNDLQEKLGENWIVKINSSESFIIYKNEWEGENKLIFGFEFSGTNYYKDVFGIFKTNKEVNIEKDIEIKFKDELNRLNIRRKTNEWWLSRYEKYFTMSCKNYDFVEYILEENSKENFINEVIKTIKIFELENNLISKINKYLNTKQTN